MPYFLNGKRLSTSAISRAKAELLLPNKNQGGLPRWSPEYWVKVVDFLGKKYKVNKKAIRKAKIAKGCYKLRLVPIPSIRKK